MINSLALKTTLDRNAHVYFKKCNTQQSTPVSLVF